MLLSALLRNANTSRFICFPDCPLGLVRGSQATFWWSRSQEWGQCLFYGKDGMGLMHKADGRYPCHAVDYEKRIVRQDGWNIWKTHSLFLSLDVCSGMKFSATGLICYFLRVKLCQPSPLISTCMVDSIMLYSGVSSEWKLCLSIFKAMTWVRLTLFLQAK